jgi:nitrite reductase (NADH) small subunit
MFAPQASCADSHWVAVGNITQIALGQGRCFRIGSRAIAIFRSRDGSLSALDATCPHRAGPLADGLVGVHTIICPLHDYKFSLIDGHGLDNELSVHRHEVMERFGELYVKLQPGREDNDAHATAS